MSTKDRIRCLTRGSTGWLLVSAGFIMITLGLILTVQWRVGIQATLGPTIALMVYSAWAQALTVLTGGMALSIMLVRAYSGCPEDGSIRRGLDQTDSLTSR